MGSTSRSAPAMKDITNSSPTARQRASTNSLTSSSSKRPAYRQLTLSFNRPSTPAIPSSTPSRSAVLERLDDATSSERGSSPELLSEWSAARDNLSSEWTSPAPPSEGDGCAALEKENESPTQRRGDVRMLVDEDEDDVEAAVDRQLALKRRRIESSSAKVASIFARRTPAQVRTQTETVSPARRLPSLLQSLELGQRSFFATRDRRALGLFAPTGLISTRAFLADFTSSNERQVFHCASEKDYQSYCAPFTLAFSHAAKAGGKQLLAVGCVEGRVNLIDAGQDSEFDFGGGRKTFQAHDNAIFDVRWSHDDATIATASGDQTVKLFDSTTQTCTGFLSGHTSSLKSVSFDPANPALLATASRDGSIRLWDRRKKGEALPKAYGTAGVSAPAEAQSIGCVNIIKNAHAAKGDKLVKGRTATKSVTAVTFLADSNTLASSGSADSVVRIWDIRKSHSRRATPEWADSNEVFIHDKVSARGGRHHGISQMSYDPRGHALYVVSTDSSVTSWSPTDLSAPQKTFTDPNMRCSSFFVRPAVSPCGRYLATGSSDHHVLLWDIHGSGKDAVVLRGHSRETTGLDWGYETLGSCSDDTSIRVWDPRNHSIARKARIDPDTRELWAGADA